MNLDKYKDYLLEAIFSDLVWNSTRKYMPTDEKSLIVYNLKNYPKQHFFTFFAVFPINQGLRSVHY